MMLDLSRLDAIAFDLDGTLVDSAPDISHALNSALIKAELRAFGLDTVRAWIGDGPDALIANALEAQGIGAGDRAVHERLRRAFDMATLAAPLSLGKVYDGIHELIASLRRRLPIAVVTNKPTPLARAVLGEARLLSCLRSVHGADTPEQRKPSPAMLFAAAERLGVAPERMLMVGDSAGDLRAARAAGCPAALVAWGYGVHAVPAGMAPWHVQTPRQMMVSLARRHKEIIDN